MRVRKIREGEIDGARFADFESDCRIPEISPKLAKKRTKQVMEWLEKLRLEIN